MRILLENRKRKKRREDKPNKSREILETEIKYIFKKIGKPQREKKRSINIEKYWTNIY